MSNILIFISTNSHWNIFQYVDFMWQMKPYIYVLCLLFPYILFLLYFLFSKKLFIYNSFYFVVWNPVLTNSHKECIYMARRKCFK